MKRTARNLSAIAAVIFTALSASASAQDSPEGKLDVYLLIGQSNMAGRAPFTKKEAGPIGGCFLLNGEDKWQPATNPLNAYSTVRKGLGMQKMNPGYGFSLRMLEAQAKAQNDVELGLVVNAKGGSSIEQWAKGTKFYTEAVRRAKEAQQSGELKGILWHQGEGNSTKPEGYLEKMTILIADLRKDLDSPELPFVAGQINREPAAEIPGVTRINEQIADLPDAVPFTGFASSDGLKAMDRWHFDAPSMRLLGERYADAMLKIQASAAKK